MKQIWTNEAWEDYNYWQTNSKQVARKIDRLLRQIERNAYPGGVKPEPLGYYLDAWWTLRIVGHHRLVYTVDSKGIVIVQCRLHPNQR